MCKTQLAMLAVSLRQSVRAGLDTLIGLTDRSMKLANAGDRVGAKAETKKFTAPCEAGHKKLC